MDSGPQLDGLFWPVPDLELLHFLEEGQCHGGDLARVPVGVPLGQPADHHVGVADRLHLLENREWSTWIGTECGTILQIRDKIRGFGCVNPNC